MADHHDPSFLSREESSLENYTGSELPFKPLYLVLVVVFITVIVFAFALVPVRDAFIRLADERAASEIVPSSERPSSARLQQSPEDDWKVWERLMAEKTAGHGWQDRANGIAYIPVDAAIEHALAEGLVEAQPGAPQSSASRLAAAHGTDHGGTSTHGNEDASAASHANDETH